MAASTTKSAGTGEGTKLVIVESPTKARKIQGYLGDGYTVLASVGHIRDLAQPSQIPASKKAKFGRFGVDIEDGFKPYYVIDPGHRQTVAQLRKALANASELYLATDEDREGEAIAWHLVQTLKPKVPIKRMVFHEITKPAILDSLKHTREVDQNMVNAQETRRVLDRLYGYELSPVLWRKVGPKLSAGRVQSVATKLIVEREKERMAFVPATYRDLLAHLDSPSDAAVPAFDARMTGLGSRRLAGSRDFDDRGRLTERAKKEDPVRLSEGEAASLVSQLGSADFTVSAIDRKPYTRHAAPPFTTSTLQQTAGNRLGMSSRLTMRAAQTLYENGFITYMRTDSIILSNEGIAAARNAISSEFGDQYLSEKPRHFANHEAGVQEAHECIRPAGATFRRPDEIASRVSPAELRLYTLIWQRTLATQMAPASGSTQTIRLTAPSDQGQAEFQASGTVITFAGFLRAYGTGAKAAERREPGADSGANGSASGSEGAGEGRLPDLREGQVVHASSLEALEHQTQPPARYTEASLVKTLEAKEIGRPSTYASIISTIIDRGYVYEKGRAMIPSWLAFSVTKLLETHFAELVDYQFTAQMEKGLDEIARGRESELDWLTRFYFGSGSDSAKDEQEATEGLQKQVSELGEIDARAINTIDIGDGVHVRVGRFGPYVEDTKDPDAAGAPRRASVPPDMAPDELTPAVARDLIRQNAGGGRVLGTDAQGNTIEVRVGRFGPYVEQISPEAKAEREARAAAKAGSSAASASPAGKSSRKASEAPRPKMASLFKNMTPETITLEQAERILSLPRTVGTYEETDGKTGEVSTFVIEANNGRYGPYLTKTPVEPAVAGAASAKGTAKGTKATSSKASAAKPASSSSRSSRSAAHVSRETRSLESEDAIFTVTLDQAKELFAQPKYRRGRRGAAKPPLRTIGKDPNTGLEVTIKDGFYGNYITDGTTNRTLPRQFTVESVTPEDCYRLLAEKREQGPRTRRTRTSRASSRGSSSRKTASRSTKTTSRSTKTASRSMTRKTTSRTSAAKKSTRTAGRSAAKASASTRTRTARTSSRTSAKAE